MRPVLYSPAFSIDAIGQPLHLVLCPLGSLRLQSSPELATLAECTGQPAIAQHWQALVNQWRKVRRMQ
jgi:hypothetical protein